jgi:hypothetical protein
MESTNIKKPILVPLFVAFTILIMVFVLSTTWMHIEQKKHMLYEPVQTLYEQLRLQQDKEAHTLQTIIKSISKIEILQKAFIARDREKLLQESLPLNNMLAMNNSITHFYFHDPDRVNFLRVHKPSRHGDLINRQTAKIAVQSGTVSWGIELGPLGTMTLRLVMPWQVNGELIGYLELGMEVSNITKLVQKQLDLQLFTFINKTHIEHKKWLSGMEMLGFQSNWDQFQKLVIMIHQGIRLPPGLHTYINSENWNKKEPLETLTEGSSEASQYYYFFSSPLHNISGEIVGRVVAVYDQSTFLYARRIHTITMITTVSILSIILALSLYRRLNRVEDRINRDAFLLEPFTLSATY